MSGEAECDLSGDWLGVYSLPIAAPPTEFQATLRDEGGLITGVTTERGDTPDCAGMVLEAVIHGRREGGTLRFAKQYDYLPRAHRAILYEGDIHPGGEEIEGRWTIPGNWSGTFMMMRGSHAGEAIERKARATV